ncbi:MAG: hypothetical protein AAF799_38355 [Myxococcota bacterium]
MHSAWRNALRSRLLSRELWAGLGLGVLAGCLTIDPFACADDTDCVFDGAPGICVQAEQTCVYADPGCVTAWSTADGSCVPAPAGGVDPSAGSSEAGEGEGEGSSSGVDPSSTETGVDTLPVDDATDGGTTTGDDDPGTTTGEPKGCLGDPVDLTPMGVAVAESTFNDDFHAFLSVDDDLTTSWFSSGPEPGGQPTHYTWSVVDPICFSQILITGNGLHANQGFQTGFGFGNVVVRVYDSEDQVVFQHMQLLENTPDPPVIVNPGVDGVRLELEFSGHEDNSCGGFSELEVVGNLLP